MYDAQRTAAKRHQPFGPLDRPLENTSSSTHCPARRFWPTAVREGTTSDRRCVSLIKYSAKPAVTAYEKRNQCISEFTLTFSFHVCCLDFQSGRFSMPVFFLFYYSYYNYFCFDLTSFGAEVSGLAALLYLEYCRLQYSAEITRLL